MKKKVALHNLGCKVNAYETEAMQQILENAGSISHKEAIEKAENEYEKFKVKQDMQYISSMDEMYQRYLDENKQNS